MTGEWKQKLQVLNLPFLKLLCQKKLVALSDGKTARKIMIKRGEGFVSWEGEKKRLNKY